MKDYFAHTAEGPDGTRDPDPKHWQRLADHLRHVADLAKRFAAPLGLADEAELAGLLHDLGKYQPDFQDYLKFGKPRTPHAAIGAGTVIARSPRIANVIASHHAGLHDWPELEPKLIEMWSQRNQELAQYLTLMGKETKVSPPKVLAVSKTDCTEAELRTRFLLSALVDADYLDTEAFHLSVAGKPCLRGPRVQLSESHQRRQPGSAVDPPTI